MSFFVVAVGLDIFTHLFDVRVRVSRVGEVRTGQFNLALVALDCCGDHPFADVLCLNDRSFPSLVQEHCGSVLLSQSHQRPCLHGNMLIPCFLFDLVSMFRTGERPFEIFEKLIESISEHLAFFCGTSKCLRVSFLLSFLLLLLCLHFSVFVDDDDDTQRSPSNSR